MTPEKARILILENHSMNLHLEEWLRLKIKHEILAVLTIDEFLKSAAELDDQLEIVIIGIRPTSFMGSESGINAAKRLRAKSSVPIVLYSVDKTEETKSAIEQIPAKFLDKFRDLHDLLGLIDEILQTSTK